MVSEGGETNRRGPKIREHARERMAERGISQEAVGWVLSHYLSRRPAPSRASANRAEILTGKYEGRTLKVYVVRDSDPPIVKTAVWQGE